jgi:titin
VSSHEIDLAWMDNSSDETGFKVERCTDTDVACTASQNFIQIAQVGADVQSYSDTSVAGSTTYTYRVKAFNAGGDSAPSNNAEATTPAPPPPPDAPSNLTAAAVSSSQIDLAWSDNSNNEDGFKIERCTGAGCSNFAQIDQVGAGVVTYSDNGLSASTTYRYRVRAFNANGDSGYSNIAEATTQAPPAPAPPTNLTATAGRKGNSAWVDLSWTDNSDNETNFDIERCTGATCTNFAALTSVGTNVTTYRDNSVARRTTYRYQVKARNSGGSSAYSNPASATTN